MSDKEIVSPYLKKPRRSLEEVLRQRRDRLVPCQEPKLPPEADNANLPPESFPPVKSA